MRRTSTSISWVGEIGFNSFRYFTTKCRTSLSFSRQSVVQQFGVHDKKLVRRVVVQGAV